MADLGALSLKYIIYLASFAFMLLVQHSANSLFTHPLKIDS